MTPSPEYRIWRRWLYGIVAMSVLLVFQLPIVARPQPQPYPGIVLPGFRETSDGATLTRSHLEASITLKGDERVFLDLQNLLTDVRESAVVPIVERSLMTDATLPPSTIDWIRRRLESMFPNEEVVALQICSNKITMDLDLAEVISSHCEIKRVIHLD